MSSPGAGAWKQTGVRFRQTHLSARDKLFFPTGQRSDVIQELTSRRHQEESKANVAQGLALCSEAFTKHKTGSINNSNTCRSQKLFQWDLHGDHSYGGTWARYSSLWLSPSCVR